MTSTRSASSGSTSGVPCFATCFQNAFSAPGRFSASSACRRCRVGLCGAGESSAGVCGVRRWVGIRAVSYTHLRAHETLANLVCRLL
ncbi:hypothetical protein KZ836_34010, partial [Pseudomonas aeruginosa]|uniref:hypothetical protein n=1 Tax=Pseudomonas aeruginosa TaxID=287 RepID=UPI001CA5A77B